MNKPFIIGIAGGSGSGKTFFLNCFLNHFTADEVSLISQDDYYRPFETQPRDENGWVNFDLPECIDDEKLTADLKKLIGGESYQKKEYTFNVNMDQAKMLTIKPAPIIIVEGLFIFHYKKLSSLFDMRIFMDAEEEITLNRRLKRDMEHRGYTHDMIMYQWVNHVLPAYNQFLLPYKAEADLLIENNSHVADDIIRISQKLSEDLRKKILQ